MFENRQRIGKTIRTQLPDIKNVKQRFPFINIHFEINVYRFIELRTLYRKYQRCKRMTLFALVPRGLWMRKCFSILICLIMLLANKIVVNIFFILYKH